MNTTQRWERLLKFEEVNREIVRLFLQLDNVDDALNESLAMTGHLLDVSRVYVFRIRENERLLDNTHEWCAEGVKPEIANLKGLPLDDLFPSLFPMIAAQDLIAPRHINELPDDLRGVLEPQDIETVLWMPMILYERVEGFIGYDETRQPREWLPEEITMARILSESYTRALEREQAERTLIRARDEAIRTAQLRAQFVANMSHEIRTPMTGILGMLELLLETDLDALQQEFASDAYNSSSRLLSIINDILDFSKLEAGQIVLEATPIDLEAIATEVRMTLKPQIKDKPLDIRLESDPAIPYRVHGDATRIRQVLMNLVGNAVKFTHEGHITLRLECTRQLDNVVVVRFAVEDTGIGISEADRNHIFESFVQADGGVTRKYGGSGLGLSISRQLVELMGGQLRVESTPGAGSTFHFTLRLPVARMDGGEREIPEMFSRLRVLLVDDNRTARYVLAQQLENWGVQVTSVDVLAEDMTVEEPFDLVFVRWHRRIEAHPVARRIVVICDHTATSGGGTACISWPADQSTLYNLLLTSIQPAKTDTATSQIYRGRVLLAEDHEMNVELVLRALNGVGIQVDCTVNGEEALRQVQQADYDLVLMDMQMPIMDGMEATRRIRALPPPYRAIPILALTASVMADERKHFLAAGVNDVISKPFSLRHLRQVVDQWLTDTA